MGVVTLMFIIKQRNFIAILKGSFRFSMTRAITIFLLCSLSVYVASDQIMVGALQKIFPYAAAAKVKTLTNTVNKQKSIAKAKAVVKKWVPKNWKATKVKPDAKNPLSKKGYAEKKAMTFIDYRYSLIKYINYLYKQAIATKYLTKEEATSMRTLFWAADAKANNNYIETTQTFMVEASQKIHKTPSIDQAMGELSGKFAKANAKDNANLQWTL
ncbi:DUF148 domain-containing protein [Caenorhabditis elegans]|uniref:DUF148 domain-containing protein n=1 Tax=Caenorhabditis elegans TaxID=6239 RepID=Q4R166_CAEEL|nr:DUF148 domain-containing protein [Caenorhabditis elegans]CCD83530.2 DUF148 domain-containing protein [Caenorhabditis elegans]|eukprot:NP_001033444.2 Uncharacterized protein CELE_Y54G2A.44 [Caenorhabditis elegans]